MNTREQIRMLEENGFTLMRRSGNNHLLYVKGAVMVPVCPARGSLNPRVVVSTRAAIRRAQRVAVANAWGA